MERGIQAVLVVLLVVVGASTALAAEDDYAISLASAVDTPDRTAELGGETFPVDAVGRVDPGESIEAHVTAPSGSYQVSVYDPRGRLQARTTASGDTTVRVDTGGWNPGSYLVAVETGGDLRTIHPLVVSAYHLDVSAPRAAAAGSSIRVEVALDPVGGDVPVSDVTALVAGAGGERRATLDGAGDGRYAGSVRLDDLPAGEYTLYVGVQGTESRFGEEELVAFGADRSVTVETDGTPGPGAGVEGDVSNEDLSPGADGDDRDDETATRTDADETETGRTTEAGTATADAGTETETDGVIAPTSPTRTDGQTGAPAGLASAWIVPAVVVAALLLLFLAYRLR